MTYAPSDNSDQPGHKPILTSHHCPHEGSLGPKLPIERIAKIDQMGRRPGLSESLLRAQSFWWFYYVAAHIASMLKN